MDGLLGFKAQLEKADFDYNPYLKQWQRKEPNEVAGKGYIQYPDKAKDIIWQTRGAPPTEEENALGDALEEVLDAGAETLQQVADGLNEHGVLAADGSLWTEQTLAAEFHRLGM